MPGKGAAELHDGRGVDDRGTDTDFLICMCATMLDGKIIVFKTDEAHWYEPCWAIEGINKDNVPTVRFMPVQKYGMSKKIEPFLREHYLCCYPAEPGIEEHYNEFVREYHAYLNREMN